MQFIDCTHGRYQIYAGALPSPNGKSGFVATLVIKIRSGDGINELNAFQDMCLVDGLVWADERDALHYAVRRGQYVIDAEPAMLARLTKRSHQIPAVDRQESGRVKPSPASQRSGA